MNSIKFRHQILLILITALSSTIFWLIFYLNIPSLIGFPATTLETIFSNYDGPNYMIISKCGYNRDCIASNFSLPSALEYYPAHFPAYPLIIRFFDNFLSGPKSMLLATLFGSIFLSLILYNFFNQFINSKKSLWLSIIMIFFPGRLFILRQIGAPETWFVAFILLSILLFRQKKYLYSALSAGFSLSFKSPGVLLGVSYLALAIYELLFQDLKLKEIFRKYIYFLFIPLILLAIFFLYHFQTGDFLAYFHSGDNFHLSLFPYTVFISNRSWINTIWLEDVIYIYFISLYGIYRLNKKYHRDLVSIFPSIFLLATLFVAHRDISRYITPIYPFLMLSFHKTLTQKSFKLIFVILLPAIILYAINFAIGNTAPIANWKPYL
ncbi:MAG: hypothetical protein WC841_01250 [Candidatus Shapirobacteria bacterium]|jgi:hypothetical protein